PAPTATPRVTTAQALPSHQTQPQTQTSPPIAYATTLRWTTARAGAYDGGPDAALLEITDPAWRPPASFRGPAGRRPQRWGRLVTDTMGQPVCCHGFARVQRGAAGDVGLEQLSARINPLTGFPARRYELTGATSAFGAALGTTGSPWAGMSGAAVFTAEPTRTPGELSPGVLLLGVVHADRGAATGVRLSVTRAEDLIDDPEFRSVVSAHNGGLPPEPEAAELVGLLAPVAPQRDLKSPLTVLRADVEAVAFRGRDGELAELRDWCVESDESQLVGALVGPGGQGKSRLAREVSARLRAEGWVAGRLRHETVRGPGADTPALLRPLNGVRRPALVVVDYAETHPELVRELVALADDAPERFRILLLARSLGTWLTTALGRSGLGYGVPDVTAEFTLRPLYTSPGPAAEAFSLAAADLARALGQVPGYEGVDWARIAAGIRPPALDDGRESPLSLHMRALESVLRRGRTPLSVGGRPRRSMEPALLDHEAYYWASTAATIGIDPDDASLLRRAVAAATLCGAASREESRAVLARLPHPRPVPVDKLDDWLRTLYPASQDSHWGGLHPDRVAEYQASVEVAADPSLLPALLTGASDAQWAGAFTVLTRAVVAHANEERTEQAGTVLERLGDVLDRIDTMSVSAAALRACAEALPTGSHVLTRFAARLAEVLVDRHPPQGAPDGPTDAERATDLHNLARRLFALSRWDDALVAEQAALDLRRRLAREEPERYEADLAVSYDMSASLLSEYDDELDRATRRITKALAVQRRLTDENPRQHRRNLAEFLRTAAYIAWRRGDSEESTRFDDEAAELTRELESTQPGEHLRELIHVLDNQQVNYWNSGRYRDAARVTGESLQILVEQMAVNPDAYGSRYARILLAEALHRDNTGDSEQAVALGRQSLALHRKLAADLPEEYDSELATALRNLGLIEHAHGDESAAISHARESVEVCVKQLVRTRRPQYAQALTGSVGSLDTVLGQDEAGVTRAVAVLDEVVGALRPALRDSGPTDVIPDAVLRLAQRRTHLGESLGPGPERGRQLAAAVTGLWEAVGLYRVLAAEDPGQHDERLADAFVALNRCYALVDNDVAQRVVLRELLIVLRRQAARDDVWRPVLAAYMEGLGLHYLVADRTSRRGLALLREAVAIEDQERDPTGPALAVLVGRLRQVQHARQRLGLHAAAVHSEERVAALLRAEQPRDPAHAASLAERPGSDLVALALSYAHTGRHAEARTLAADGVARSRAAPDTTPAELSSVLRAQAETLLVCARHTGRRATALAALGPAREALDLVARPGLRDRTNDLVAARPAADCLADVLDQLGRRTEAAGVRRRVAPPTHPRGGAPARRQERRHAQ
ncbi:tetratricopeptide repeat protein, partial [Streptomyces atriruber]|uniref:tetratricopeptide repeat protein n=1 Tax=Streptomyces atriruber TaxID=545121 RepID=UPI0006E18520